MKYVSKIERTAYLLFSLIVQLGLYPGITDETCFDTKFVWEDGPVVWGTTIMLLV